jgi:hypothetical protein
MFQSLSQLLHIRHDLLPSLREQVVAVVGDDDEKNKKKNGGGEVFRMLHEQFQRPGYGDPLTNLFITTSATPATAAATENDAGNTTTNIGRKSIGAKMMKDIRDFFGYSISVKNEKDCEKLMEETKTKDEKATDGGLDREVKKKIVAVHVLEDEFDLPRGSLRPGSTEAGVYYFILQRETELLVIKEFCDTRN